MDTWRRQNPTWEIEVLSPTSFQHHLDEDARSFLESPAALQIRSLGPVQFSDLVRVEVLAAQGGLWLDATIALTEPLELWVSADSDSCFQGFDLDFAQLEAKAINLRSDANWTRHFVDGKLVVEATESFRMPETWAFATTGSSCDTMMKWRDAQRRLILHEKGYVEALREQTEGFPSSYRKWLPYLFPSFCLWQASTGTAAFWRRSEDWAFKHLEYMPKPWLLGPSLPLDYITDYAGGPIFALAATSPGPSVGPLMKLRRFDRCALDAIIAFRSYGKDSVLVKIYDLPLEPIWWPPKLGEAFGAFEANHCGTDDVALLVIFGLLRRLCRLIFFCNDHPSLSLALAITCFRLCQLYSSRSLRKKAQ
eukprot:Skav222177  [mRNA]  locus=scaffold5891:26285:27379:- [translate_table: standard]